MPNHTMTSPAGTLPRAAAAALLMLLARHAQAQPPGLEALKASNAYIDCLMKAARKLDDGHSPAASMGQSIQAACAGQQQRWENAQTAHFPEARKRAFHEEIKARTDAIAVNIVLEERRFKRN